MTTPDPVTLMKDALREAGYGNIAATVVPNRLGRPMSEWYVRIEPTRKRAIAVVRAARLAQMACGPDHPAYADTVPEDLSSVEEAVDELLPIWTYARSGA